MGHVTKDGAIAGPRVLEHMVDTVLYFEGGGAHPYRVLRAHKNRFGSASEIGVFEMKAGGLAEVPNPSALFLAERPQDAAGSAVTAGLSGTRTLLVEVQALVAPTGFGTPAPHRARPRRQPGGPARRRAGEEGRASTSSAATSSSTWPAASTLDDPPPTSPAWPRSPPASATGPSPARTIVLGEVGLAGEVRAVSQADARLAEAGRLGFARAVLPAGNARHAEPPPGLALDPVESVAEALEVLAGG